MSQRGMKRTNARTNIPSARGQDGHHTRQVGVREVWATSLVLVAWAGMRAYGDGLLLY